MASSVILFFIVVFCAVFCCSLGIDPVCSNTSNFTRGSTYSKNRDLVLSRIPTNVSSDGGFYMGTLGQGRDRVYALGLCRADTFREDCLSCVKSLTEDVLSQCPNSVEAYTWEGDPPCILRYSNTSFFGKLDTSPTYPGYNVNNITSNMKQFDNAWGTLMNDLTAKAASGSSRIKFAAGDTNLTTSQRIYAALQCTPDLTQVDCSNCLKQAVMDYRSCCHGRRGGYVHKPSCFFRWDLYQFLQSSTYTSPPPAPGLPPPSLNTSKGANGTTSSWTIVAIVASILIFVLLIFTVLYVSFKKKKRNTYRAVTEQDGGTAITDVHALRYDLLTIEAATGNFSNENKIGEGGYGDVYKGTLLDRREIAVKRLSKCSSQGAREFKNEVILVARLQHRNLVRLLGYCLQGEEKILIYEFLPKRSLDNFLFDPQKKRQLNWTIRYKVIVGTARGLLYLHEESQLRVIHRDLKASNILLDDDFNPKISDFGMARMFNLDQTQGNTRRIVGTYGYMPPEYAYFGRFSIKSDVFSFGVLILEIISGKKNANNAEESDHVESLVSIAWKHWRKGEPLALVDSSLGDSYTTTEVIRCIHLALLCVEEDPAHRPTMQNVVLMLNSYSTNLPLPRRPAFLLCRMEYDGQVPGTDQTDRSDSKSMPWSLNEVSITEPAPR